ncbi:MAG: DUF3971 domain-containing protein, partial [Gammaproteobacteria bacterium]|nr:DUF3971 domain-containing protein [Gammaproteobacteria bacterium]
MKSWLNKLVKMLAYLSAAVVILLAIAVGLFRLMLPRLPEYQEQIKGWASAAIGMRVEFSDMDARWRLSGPELSFSNARLSRAVEDSPLLSVEEVSVGVSLMRLLSDRELVADRIVIRDAEVDVVLTDDRAWIVQGLPIDELLGSRAVSEGQNGDMSLVARDILVRYQHPGVDRKLTFSVDNFEMKRDDDLIAVDANVDPPEGFGDRLTISVSQRPLPDNRSSWQFFVEGSSLDIAAWSVLQPAELPQIRGGLLDLSLWFQRSSAGLQSATANFALNDLAAGSSANSFGASGRLEFTRVNEGWLLAGSDFSLDTSDGDAWPQSNWQIQAGLADDGELQSMSVGSSFLRLQDLKVFEPWLAQSWQQELQKFSPDGILRDLSFSQTAMDSEATDFELSIQMESAGFSAVEQWPGVRGFSGRLRADSAGGRLEIDSGNLYFSLPAELAEPVQLDDAIGTIIWRRNAEGTIVLSDSIWLRNTDLSSQSSLQISVPADGGSAIIDLQSDWSVNDIGTVERYLPRQTIKPALYKWLTSALVSGRIPQATTRLAGPLDRFPFDADEGVFRIDARVEDAVLQYSEQWPVATNMDLEIVVDKTRLYSHRNSAVNAGNSVQDARIEIANLRAPVLEIDAFATGTMESIRDFSQRSPIAGVLGGQLERLEVDGDASFNLKLSYPIADKENFDFETRIRTSDGSIRVQGFPAPVTELNGLVVVSRDDIRSEMLFGRFLGEPVDIGLSRAGEDLPAYTVVATANGHASAEAITEELGVALEAYLSGATPFTASLYFPARQETLSAPFRIQVETSMPGFAVELPPPFRKLADETAALSFSIEIPQGDRIESSGSYRDELNWALVFEKSDDGWDFDRGVLALGESRPGAAETRGLHIEGELARLRFDDWLRLIRSGSGQAGIGERIRSIDLTIGEFDVIGQLLTDQRVIVNRSAEDWVIELDGRYAKGTVSVPYDFSGNRPLSLDMQTLILPGKEESGTPDDGTPTDPRALPAISVKVAEFALGNRYLGELITTFDKTANGIESRNFE